VTLETTIFTALKSLVSDRVYRDIAPQTVTTLPRITFQQVGGDVVNFLDGGVPSMKNARIQVNCWGQDRDSVMAVGRDAEDALRSVATVLGGLVALPREEATGLYGCRQDFSVWFTD